MNDFITLMSDKRVSLRSKLFFVAAVVVYLVLPIDLIPDVFLPVGFVDDGGVILAAMALFVRQARAQLERDFAVLADAERNRLAAPETDGEDLSDPETQNKSVIVSEAKMRDTLPGNRHIYSHGSSPGSGVSWGCMAFFVTLILSPFVGIAILLLSGSMALNSLIAPIFDAIGAPATVNIVSSRTIVNSVRGLGQLVTVRVELAKTDIRVSIHEGFLNSGYYSANHVAFGIIEAGIDISEFGNDNLNRPDNQSMVLTLPAPIVTSCNIEHIDQYENSFSLLQKDWDTVRQLAEFDAIMAFRQDALEGGILEEAKDEVTYRLGNFVSELTGAQVQIDFEEPADLPVYGDTCYPDPPSGWQKDENGEWGRTN